MITFISFSILLWILFIVFSNLRNRILPKVKGTVGEVPIYWLFVLFAVVDVIYNVTYGSILFLQLPHYKRLTLTARLKYILHEQDMGWRWKLADFVCRRMIEPWDSNHCALG